MDISKSLMDCYHDHSAPQLKLFERSRLQIEWRTHTHAIKNKTCLGEVINVKTLSISLLTETCSQGIISQPPCETIPLKTVFLQSKADVCLSLSAFQVYFSVLSGHKLNDIEPLCFGALAEV